MIANPIIRKEVLSSLRTNKAIILQGLFLLVLAALVWVFWPVGGLQDIGGRHVDFVDNVRGLGVMCAFDVPSGEARDAVVSGCLEDGLIVLPCGTKSVRFRPALTIEPEEIDEALERVDGTLKRVARDLPAVQTAN